MNIAVLAVVIAQSVIMPKRPVPVPPVPVFRPSVIQAAETPVEVKSESVAVADNGLFRRVETTVTFTNPNSRVFEGELELPLPDGAFVCGYALEINGELVPGVVVGKEEARVAFENEKRKGVDPGLVEHVKGNLWKTRIYPLMPRTPRRCRVTYVEELKPTVELAVERCGGETFVAARETVVSAETKADRLRRAKTAVILWDASMSRQGRTEADRALLELLPETGDYTLVVFRDIVESPVKFPTRAALLAAVDALVYDGATCLEKAMAACPGAFVFSDEYREPKPRAVSVRRLADGEKPPKEPVEGTLLASVWAARRIEDYGADAEARKAEFLELGRKYGVASPVTSLLVLETLQQYKTYRIEPPKCLGFHDAWKKWHDAEDDAIAAEREKANHRSQLLGYWEERIRWWKDPIPPKATPKSGVFDGVRRAARRAMGAMTTGSANESVVMVDEEMPAPAAPMAERMARPRPAMEESRSMRSAMKSKSAARPEGGGAVATVKLAAWDPKMPYLEAMGRAPDAYAEYLKQRDLFGTSPAFYLDCAGWFFRKGERVLGARVISNLREMKLEEVGLWRTMGWRLREAGLYDEAVEAFRHVLGMRGEEPQSKRDLALVLTERGKAASSAADLGEAAKLLHEAAFRPAARRSGRRGNDLQTSVMALEELNGLFSWVAANASSLKGEVKLPELEEAFRREMPLALRIMLSWDTDETDVDLHVLEPDGEEAYYGHRRTSSGGFVSEDVTTGYGPEEYLRKESRKGVYRIAANYYASHRQALTGAATVTATVYTDWGTAKEKREVLSFRLDKPKDKQTVGEVKVD